MSDRLYIVDLDGMEQSAVDLDDSTNLVFDYMRRVGDLIDGLSPARPAPLRVLHIGGAGMSMPRYVAATRPRSSQIVLEPNVELIDEVRVQAPLPARSGIRVRVVDGASGILGVAEASQNVVILDAFERGEVPEELMTAGFLEQVQRVLVGRGVFVANVVDQRPFPHVRSLVGLARGLGAVVVGAEAATAKGRRRGNVLVACGAVPWPAFGTPSPMDYRVYTGRTVADTFGA